MKCQFHMHFGTRQYRGRPEGGPKILVYIYKGLLLKGMNHSDSVCSSDTPSIAMAQ